MKVRDQLDREIYLPKIPERIISLVPSQTELLADMGLEEEILGITHFCVHPDHLKSTKTRVGGTKKVNLRKIRELQPDIIFCNKEENTKEMVADLEKIAPVHISDVYTLNDAYDLIESYGSIFNKEMIARTIISSIQKEEKALRNHISKEKKKVAYFIWNEPIMVAGKQTFIDSMLELNNFENVIVKERYPEVNEQFLKELDIDICLLSSEPYPFKEQHKKLFTGYANEVKIVNGEYFSWYGSRLLKAMDYFSSLH